MGPVGSLSLLNTLCPSPAPSPVLLRPLSTAPASPCKPSPAGKFLLSKSRGGGARNGAAWGPPGGSARPGEDGVPSLRVGSGLCPFRCSRASQCPGLCTSRELSGKCHPQLMLRARGHLLTSQKTSCLGCTGAAGRAGWAERGSCPSPAFWCLRGGGGWPPGSFLAAPTLRAVGCKERRQCEFFRCPQRINVLELSSRLRFSKAEQQICFKFGSRQRRAGGRNFPGIALHFPLKGLCFGAGD